MELVTRDEKAALEERLSALLANRPLISQRIAEARALGDLKENAEYHSAREEQGLQEAEIRRLEERLARVSVIDESMHRDLGVVFLGATVRLREVGSDEEELFRLVGESSGSATPRGDVVEVTLNSPMGEALLKARVGETVGVRTPRGVKHFEILGLV
ncbi:MAG TPA: transcription elongation factor GreA [Phycisphaerales bacterium]|nr:transcription elongation factor GreA [Phycisphaerales bacterium]